MPFNELVRGNPIPDSKAREAEDIVRSKKDFKTNKARRKSVTIGTIRGTIAVLSVLFGIALLSGVGYLIYLGFQTYVNG